MNVRKFWTQLHWLLGISVGSLLLLIGLSGAVVAFREEVLQALNPATGRVVKRDTPLMTPDQLLHEWAEQRPGERVGTLTLYAEPELPARLVLEPRAGERRGDTLFVNPYTGLLLEERWGQRFFEFTESLHRWLLLPREPGRVVTGLLAIGLLILSLSGLYLRWPRHWKDRRTWWHIDTRLRGRALWRRLHLVAGTACLVLYLALTTTGIFWAFDGVRDPVSAWLGEPRPAKAETPKKAGPKADGAGEVSLATAWTSFGRATSAEGWSEVIIRVPTQAKAPMLFTWLNRSPAHERARNRTTVNAATGEVMKDERFAAKPLGGKILAAIYPLHMGTLLGLPGRLAMLAAALILPAFTITGWWLYLDRRKLKRAAEAKRQGLRATA
ncbi:Uncharacterized iron-regulated membrane protein [Roseateles sp. YR242]|uniref:PepSY-associated TM helix domain-containing protein n=1 Tax=Roseateles sp. YR242 TaxID=1855305 RepID=UPI0008B6FAE0|nr:PepSY-associated TM helix domain-containing protein [Roseateles sp. YR242]SEK62503.1 Uncharacterized iron-regulated membrane protein [Roseateles sp. YR242]